MRIKNIIASTLLVFLALWGQSCTKDQESIEEVVNAEEGEELSEDEVIEASEEAAEQMEEEFENQASEEMQEESEMVADASEDISDVQENAGLDDGSESMDAEPTYSDSEGLSYSDDSAGDIADNEDDTVDFNSSTAVADTTPVEVEPEAAPAEDISASVESSPSPELTTASENYIVQPGDTLSIIANKLYGDGSLWKRIADENNMGPNQTIYPGDTLAFDKSNEKASAYMTQFYGAMKTVTVQKGDTLSKIAKRLFGDGSSWNYLYQINSGQIQNPDVIYVGQVLQYVDIDKKVQLSH